jgi:hypothetical protein
MPPLKKIAYYLRTDEASATYFSLAVQRNFNHAPSFNMIARAVELLPPQKRGIDSVVEWLKCEWPNLQMKSDRKKPSRESNFQDIPQPVTDKNVTSSKRQKRPPKKSISPTKTRGGYSDRKEPESFSPILWQGRDPRNALEGLPKCPHGVLIGRKCALCDPEGFELYHGDE